jgi:hypothetical protein
MRSSKLAVHAVIATIAGVMASAASLLLRAWTLDYWQAWVFIVVFVGSIGAIGTYLALNDPALFAAPLQGRTTDPQNNGPPNAPSSRQNVAMTAPAIIGLGHLDFTVTDGDRATRWWE